MPSYFVDNYYDLIIFKNDYWDLNQTVLVIRCSNKMLKQKGTSLRFTKSLWLTEIMKEIFRYFKN